MPDDQPTSRSALLFQFMVGCAYLAIIAGIFAAVSKAHFLWSLLAVLSGALFCCGLALFWIVGWALRKDARPGQFGIRSLLFLAVYVALYGGLVRWLANHAPDDEEALPAIAVICLIGTAISVPVLIFWMESLLWFAVWIVRRKCVQSWLARRRNRALRRDGKVRS